MRGTFGNDPRNKSNIPLFRQSFVVATVAYLVLLAHSVGFPFQSRGAEYYSAAELSYRSGDYGRALMYYELAIIYDKTIESDDPNIKLKMGICAYMIGDYDKAQTYLSGYDTEFAKSLLESVRVRKKQQDDWKRWISSARSMMPEQGKPQRTPSVLQLRTILILVLLFVSTFAALFFAEVRIYKLRRRVIELPAPNLARAPAEGPPQVVLGGPSEVQQTEQLISEEFTLLPKDAKLVDFDQLLQSELDVFKDILEPSETEQFETPKTERESLIDEVLGETRELIKDLSEMASEAERFVQESASEAKAEEKFEIQQAENLDKIEMELLEKLGAFVQSYETRRSGESTESLEIFTLMQKPFHEFDTLESISVDEARILSKKLVAAVSEKLQPRSSQEVE